LRPAGGLGPTVRDATASVCGRAAARHPGGPGPARL